MIGDRTRFPNLDRMLTEQLRVWPACERFLARRFEDVSGAEMERVETLAGEVLAVAGDDLAEFCDGYRWICQKVLEEEEYFRREKHYRLSRVSDAYEQVYSRPEVMRPYMRGLLMTQVWWSNHTAAISHYRDRFLPGNKEAYRHLEVGPGHGLLFHHAVSDPRCARAVSWDWSVASIEETRQALERLGTKRDYDLLVRDLFSTDPVDELFDSVVISEVCEHLETPELALGMLKKAMAPGGRIFVNMPINSPAPDHVFLLTTPEAVADLVRSAGFAIEEVGTYPGTGYTEAQARKHALTISCVVVGTNA